MRVLVDTSVWVDFFNQHPSHEADLLTRLIEDEAEIRYDMLDLWENLPS